MHRTRFTSITSIFTLCFLLLMACSNQGFSATNTPAFTPTAVPTATLDIGERFPEAETLCPETFSSSQIHLPYMTPMLTILYNEDISDRPNYQQWGSYDLGLPQGEVQEDSELKTLLCISEHADSVGVYSGPSIHTAYQIIWDVSLVQWPSGIVLDAISLQGSDPPAAISGDYDAYGQPPTEELARWVSNLLQSESAFVTGLIPLDDAVSNGFGSLAFSPDGELLAYRDEWCCPTIGIRIWDIAAGEVVRSLEVNATYMTFFPDGKTLAVLRYDRVVELWDVTTGQSIRTIEDSENSMDVIRFSPDQTMMAAGGYFGKIDLLEVPGGEIIRTLPVEGFPADSLVRTTGLAFSADGRVLATAIEGQTIRLWDVSTGDVIETLEGHEIGSSNLLFSPDGELLAFPGQDNTIILWDVTTGQIRHTLSGHMNPASNIVFSTDSRLLVSGSSDGTLLLWDVSTGQLVETLHGPGVDSLALSPDGKLLASRWSDEVIVLWDISLVHEGLSE